MTNPRESCNQTWSWFLANVIKWLRLPLCLSISPVLSLGDVGVGVDIGAGSGFGGEGGEG